MSSVEDEEARQLKEVLKETGNRRRHRTNSSTSSNSSSSSVSNSRTSSHENVYPTLPLSSSTASSVSAFPSSASSSRTPFTGGWKPASSLFTGAQIAQPAHSPVAQPVSRQSSLSDDKDYVFVDDDSPQSAELSQILRRQSLTKTNIRPTPASVDAPPPPLSQGLSGDMRYAQQLQEEEEKLVRQEKEDRKKAVEIAKQEEDDRKYAELLQRREEFEAGQAATNDDQPSPLTQPTRSHPTSRPTSSSTSGWSGSFGPFSVSVSAGHGSHEHMFSQDELRARLLERMQRMGFPYPRSFDSADEYDDDMHTYGRFRPTAHTSPFLNLHGFPGAFPFHGQPDVDNMSYEQLLELSERMGQVKPKGMAAEQLSVLPTWRWKGPVASDSASDEKDEKRSGGSDADASCSICLTSYDSGEEIKRLPCMRQNIHITAHHTSLTLWPAHADRLL